LCAGKSSASLRSRGLRLAVGRPAVIPRSEAEWVDSLRPATANVGGASGGENTSRGASAGLKTSEKPAAADDPRSISQKPSGGTGANALCCGLRRKPRAEKHKGKRTWNGKRHCSERGVERYRHHRGIPVGKPADQARSSERSSREKPELLDDEAVRYDEPADAADLAARPRSPP